MATLGNVLRTHACVVEILPSSEVSKRKYRSLPALARNHEHVAWSVLKFCLFDNVKMEMCSRWNVLGRLFAHIVVLGKRNALDEAERIPII